MIKNLIQVVFVVSAIFAAEMSQNLWTFILVIIGSFCCAILTDLPAGLVEKSGGVFSKRFRIPAVVVGATFLAIASSAPEFLTSLSGVLFFKTFKIGIAAILWSSLFNTCVINGVCAVKSSKAINIKKDVLFREMAFYVVSLSLFLFFAFDGFLTSLECLIVVSIYPVYIWYLSRDASTPYKDSDDMSIARITGLFVTGMLLIGVLCYFMIELGESAIHTAKELWNIVIPVSILGATIYGSGTSFADLMVSVKASGRGERGAAISNALGSNTFDIAIALGIPGFIYTLMIGDIVVDVRTIIPITVMLYIGIVLTSIFLYPGRLLDKKEGWILISYFSICLALQFFLSFVYGL